MLVRELIEVLQRCDPEAIVVFNSPFSGGYVQPNTVVASALGGVEHRHSFEYVNAIELVAATPGWLKTQGFNVVAEVPACSRVDHTKSLQEML